MYLPFLPLALLAQPVVDTRSTAPDIDELELPPVIITASRIDDDMLSPADAVSYVAPDDVAALGQARHTEILRTLPSAALAETGPPGTQAQLRIRGAEANHTLLFVNGIKANDPAAGNEARFELLTATLGDAIELHRGPQSARFGSEAIGGVVAVRTMTTAPFTTTAEAGSDDFFRLDGSASVGSFSGAAGYQRSGGIDSFGGPGGDRDGYEQLTGRINGDIALDENWTLGLAGFALDATSDFDGFDPLTFQRADTQDATDNRLGAAGGKVTGDLGRTRLSASASLLASSNRNRLGDTPLNDTSAERLATGIEAQHGLTLRDTDVTLLAAVVRDDEWFRADDTQFGGLTRQDRSRANTGLVAEARARRDGLSVEAALRHDVFSAFDDATTVSSRLTYAFDGGLYATAAYDEGIAQPSFTDLFGFFPASFVGNPDLQPERSRGGEIGLGYGNAARDFVSLTLFTQRLSDEIVTAFDAETFLSSPVNAKGTSQRRGIEVEGAIALGDVLRLAANYSYLDASEADVGALTLREVRRPEHRAAAMLTGNSGAFTYGTTLTYVGERLDTDFDLFPATRVRLAPYVIADARVAYAVTETLDLFVRGRNLFDSDYQDVVGYNTPGRGLYAGIALRR